MTHRRRIAHLDMDAFFASVELLRYPQLRGLAVVIGGGLLGLEAAAGLAARGMKVTVLHAVGWPMERQLCTESGALLADRLRDRGLKLLMDARTEAIEGGDRAEAVRLADGTRVPARLVVMAVGVRPDAARNEPVWHSCLIHCCYGLGNARSSRADSSTTC